jgi:phospholipid/cholesterol/gamma-HCH transport system permease protein
MEAANARLPRQFDPIETPERSGSAKTQLTRGLWHPVRSVCVSAGEMAAFMASAVFETRGVWRYTAEVLRQAGIIIVGSALLIWGMELVLGTMCATEADYSLRSYGATAYAGVFTAFCDGREMSSYMFGYVVSAKIGCGLVAELGSMRINEEIDALEAQGLNPMRFLVATRLVAAWLAFPMLLIVGMGVSFLGNFLIIVVQIGEVSRGAFDLVHWGFLSPEDLLFNIGRVMVTGSAIVLVGMYYGYHARGGPAGVGTATARSMIVNLMSIQVINGAFSLWHYASPSQHIPIGG